MKLAISCTHADDLQTAEDLLVQFGEASGCAPVKDSLLNSVAGNVPAQLVSAVEDAVAAINAQISDGRTFQVVRMKPKFTLVQ